MGNIFVSHVIADEPLMREIVRGLEAAGYTAWFFERDVLPGTSYLIQITRAIECCDALVLLVTPAALASDQVTKEVVGAFERRIPFFPVLVDVTPPELKERQPEWRHALGGTAMFTVGSEGLPQAVSRVIDGLQAMGIQPEEGKAEALTPAISSPAYRAPRELTERILAARSTVEGERRQVTVLCVEITGLGSGKLDPEELHDLLAPCLELMSGEIHRYEGTVAQFTGHGIMAIFGAPIAHEDDPRRALHAALDMRRRFGDHAEGLEARGLRCSLRMGLNTGLVIVGRIGDDLAMEYTAVGDTVDLAAGMKDAAEPGDICVSEAVYHLAEGYFDFEDLGEIEVRGEEAPLRAYRVLSSRHAATRVEASLARGLTRFVGRERELEHLAYYLGQVREGRGQVVGVIGEPGVGKSRLAVEFTRSLPQGDYTCLEGGCYHYGEDIPYLPVLEILRDYFGIGEGEDQGVIKKRIGERTARFDGQLDDILPPLHEVLSLEVEDQEYLKLEPQQRRLKVFEAIRRLLVAESQLKPLVITVEDLHWIDRTSEEFLAYLIDSLPTASILLVLLYRPDYTPAWFARTFFSQVRVDQLPEEKGADLVQSILAGGEVAEEICDLVVGRAAGNPLFIEELTHGLLENGSIVKDDDGYVLSGRPTDIEVPGHHPGHHRLPPGPPGGEPQGARAGSRGDREGVRLSPAPGHHRPRGGARVQSLEPAGAGVHLSEEHLPGA